VNEPSETTLDPAAKVLFSVKNRSRAEKVAKILYGPTARFWMNRGDGVQVGVEKNGEGTVIGTGKNFAEALRRDIQDYLKDDATAWERAKQLFVYADVTEFLMGRSL
jgi:hypothetical protein